jgi:hypothetical protein
MTLNRFKQVCKDYGLDVEINQYCKNENGEYLFARTFFKHEDVAFYDKGKIFCFKHPTIYRYLPKKLIIDKGKATEINTTSELEENIVKTIGELKKLLIIIKKCEIENDFQ